jgi:hypothetical protein
MNSTEVGDFLNERAAAHNGKYAHIQWLRNHPTPERLDKADKLEKGLERDS